MKTVDSGLRLTPLGKKFIIAGALALSIAVGCAAGASAHCANPVALTVRATNTSCTRLGRCIATWDVKTGRARHTVYVQWWGKSRIKTSDRLSVTACLSPYGGTVKGRIRSVSR